MRILNLKKRSMITTLLREKAIKLHALGAIEDAREHADLADEVETAIEEKPPHVVDNVRDLQI